MLKCCIQLKRKGASAIIEMKDFIDFRSFSISSFYFFPLSCDKRISSAMRKNSHRVLKSHILDHTISKGVTFVPYIPGKDLDQPSLVRCSSLDGVVNTESGSYRTNKAFGATPVYESFPREWRPLQIGHPTQKCFM